MYEIWFTCVRPGAMPYTQHEAWSLTGKEKGGYLTFFKNTLYKLHFITNLDNKN